MSLLFWLAAALLCGLLSARAAAWETLLLALPRDRFDGWKLPGRTGTAPGDFAHPRDCLFTALLAGGGLFRGLCWASCVLAASELQQRAFLGIWLAAALLLGAAVVAFDVLPRCLALRQPAALEPGLQRFASRVLGRLGPVFDRLQPVVARAVRFLFPWASEPRAVLGPAEAETLVRMRGEDGGLSYAESEVLTEVLRLSHATVRHYMTPRVDVFAVSYQLDNEQLRAALVKRRFHRVPVVGDGPDEILGILDTQALHRLPPGMHFTEALLPPSFVPQTMEASQLLQSFLRHRQPMAVVLDEYGGVKGLVTLSDLMEELLADAAPRLESDLYIERLGDGRILASGTARLEDLGEHIGFDATREGVETIAGYVIHSLGQLPRPGASVRLGAWKVTVRKTQQRRIREVSLEPAEPEEPTP